jgi:ATP-binding cassette subfamily G (WHITE) protein 2 (SNQ2)
LSIELVADTFNHSQNFGIIIAFGVGFLICLLTLTEINTGHTGEASATLFKAGSKTPVIKEAEAAIGGDEEKGRTNSSPSISIEGREGAVQEGSKAKQAIREQPKMLNTFSWQHISYVVSVSGDKRQLLDDVSGYVAPGKLTALMGESGAGKVKYLGNTI